LKNVIDLSTISDYDGELSTLMNFAVPRDEGTYVSNHLKGWFKAPETTKYRFYMSCDDGCTLKLSETPNDIGSAKEIISKGKAGYKNYFDLT